MMSEGKQEELPYEESELYRIRHSAAHVMAEAVLEFFPDAKLAIGPPIQTGFYYDFDLGKNEDGSPLTFSPDDLENIENKMKALLKKNAPFERSAMSIAEALSFFADQPYKVELIQNLAQGKVDENGEPIQEAVTEVGIYQHRDFVDLCRGPHVSFTKKVKANAVKLLSSSGAYWRGDSNRPMLQRIYGTAWKNKSELEEYLNFLEEAEKRDHRALGRSLDLFSTSQAVGPGLILWHPKGGKIRFLAEQFSQEAHLLNGYEWVFTPHIGRGNLWETSGHLKFFRDAMYKPLDVDGEAFYLKPMNCPFHIQIYKSHRRSYRDLPLRYAEYGTVYRYELSGTLHGMTRVRGFTQDDAHVFCLPEQVEDEVARALKFSLYVLRTFGLEDFVAYISTRPEEKAIGSIDDWDKATSALRRAVEHEGLPYEYDEGGGAFYGPKIDLKVKDALGREWQLSTVQFDFNLPERFDMEYIGEDNKPHRPLMVHRALFGSVERFFGLLIEHYAGAFPLWLAPVQVVVVPISDKHLDYAHVVASQLKQADMRVEIDAKNERMQAKIRRAEMEKVPFIFVVGDKEAEQSCVAVRSREEGDVGTMTIEQFLEMTDEARHQGIAKAII